MKKVYEKAEVKVYELEMETSLLVGESGKRVGFGETIKNSEIAGEYIEE